MSNTNNNSESFVHCHVHTAFSMLDGKANVEELVSKVAEEGQPAIAITDHGNTFGAYEMYKIAKKYNVKPIIGSELYAAPGDMPRTERKRVQWGQGGEDDVSGGGAFTHLTVLSETTEGMHNLFKISSESFKSGYYYKARCLTPGQKIMTNEGLKNVENMNVGDTVLTHKGAWCEVVEVMCNKHEGKVYDIITTPENGNTLATVTGEHPIFVLNLEENKRSWVDAETLHRELEEHAPNAQDKLWLCVPKPFTLSTKTVEDVSHINVEGYKYDKNTLNLWVSDDDSRVVKFPHHLPLSSQLGSLLAFFIVNSGSDNKITHIEIVQKKTKTFNHTQFKNLNTTHHLNEITGFIKRLCGETVAIYIGEKGGSGGQSSEFEHFTIKLSNPVLAHSLRFLKNELFEQKGQFWGFTRAPESFTEGFLQALLTLTQEYMLKNPNVSPLEVLERLLPPGLAHVVAFQFVRLNLNFVNPRQGFNEINTFPLVDDKYAYLPLVRVKEGQYEGFVYNIETEHDHSYVSNITMHNCDRELLAEHSKGLIGTTGCPSGEVQTRLRLGQTDEALQAAAVYRDIFGPDNYYVEIMDHGLNIERRTQEGLLWIANQLQLPLLATNDLHYVSRSDAPSHEAMLCVQSGSKLSDPKRFKFDAEEFYLKSSKEMRDLFPNEDFPGACDNTLLVAQRCDVQFDEGADLMPKFPVPEGETINTWFVKEVEKGLQRRYPNGVPEHNRKLAEYEMSVIQNMGYPGYFLVTADFIMWAKNNGIRVGPGRGCLRGDSLITTIEGKKEIRNITTEDLVADGNGQFVHPEAVHVYETEEQLCKIELPGSDLYLTPDHKVLRRVGVSGHETEWVRADELNVGDSVCDPVRMRNVPYFYYKVRSVSLGHLGDGKVYDLTIPTTKSYVANNIVVHNSAAGSIVAYAMGITEIDPVEHNLIFERFLNPDRVTMPDIDVDFDDSRRNEVINYVTEKYGSDKVAQIVTFSIVKAKAAVKDAARILDEPFKTGEKITKLVPPPIVGKDMPLWAAFEPSHERYKEAEDLRKLYKNDPTSKKVIDTALGLEGVTRQWGVHAAGIILSAEPLTDHIPVLKREADGAIITQFDQKTCETLGLLKMDFLGLRNLTVIDETVQLIKKNKDIDLVPEELPYNDEKTFALLSKGETLGVFQLDSTPMRALLRSMKPDKFEDISAVLALYRPGPMAMNSHNEYADRKNQRKPITPIHPELKEPLGEILGDTYGLCVSGDTLIWDVDLNKQVRVDSISEKVAQGKFYTYAMKEKGELTIQKVKAWYRTGMKETLTLKTTNGQSIRVSPDHLMLTRRGWKLAGELKAKKDQLKHYSPRVQQKENRGVENFNGGTWCAIDTIHRNAAEPVYDITVDTEHNFLANSLVAHNCIYQEQVQKIAQKLAGYSLGHADLLRRAMGKKDKKILDEEFKPFQEGMVNNGYSEEAVKKLWEVLIPFADYAFNKAHTVAYGTLSYWTAYLKANHPAEYMSALLTSVGNDKDKTALYMNECKRMGIQVLPPDVNESGAHYTPVSETSIRVGLSAIRNVGENVVKEIIKVREKEGNFTSFGDFLQKVPSNVYNKRTIDSLIKAAAFSQLHENRAALSAAHVEAVDAHAQAKKRTKKGQSDMFSVFAEETGGSHSELFKIPEIPEWGRVEKLGYEREMLGRYITDHPLRGYQRSVVNQADDYIVKLFPPDELPKSSRSKVAGVVTGIALKKTKKGDTYANVTIEDLTGTIDVMFLPTSWETSKDNINNDAFISAHIKTDYREDGSFSLLGNDAQVITTQPDPRGYVLENELNPTPLIMINVEEEQLTQRTIMHIKDLIKSSEGGAVIRMRVRKVDGSTVVLQLPDLVDHNTILWEMKGLFGENAVNLTTVSI